MFRRIAAALLSLSTPLAAQDIVGFDATDFGKVVLTRKQSTGRVRMPEVALGAYNNEPIVTYSANSVFARMGRAVGRLDILTDSGVYPCTAFIVGKATLLTNHHCVPGIVDNPDAGATRIEAIQFVAGYTRQGVDAGTKRYFVSVEPVESFRDLDYSVLRVIGDPSEDFGQLDLVARDPSDGDPFWIIGHPMGEAQRISREKCRANAPALSDGHLLHTCDTLPGNSGSPVIDAGSQSVIALHHAGSERDAVNFAIPMGRILDHSSVLVAAASPPDVPDGVTLQAPRAGAPGPDLTALLDEVASMGFRLGKEREAREKAQEELDRLQAALDAARAAAEASKDTQDEVARLTADRDDALAEVSRHRQDIVALRTALSESEAARAGAEDGVRRLEEQLAAALAARGQAEQRLSKAGSAADVAEAEKRATEAERRVAVLNEQVETLRQQLREMQALVEESRARDAAGEARLNSLGSDLNAALARLAQEERRRRITEEDNRKLAEERAELLEGQLRTLETRRNPLFDKMRKTVGSREGLRVMDGRFVLSADRLFAPGSTDITRNGAGLIEAVVRALRHAQEGQPDARDWHLSVEGHTDDLPIRSGGAFVDNRHVSQARALSVMRVLIDSHGIPPERVSATGFGPFQPLDPGHTPTARAHNRRVELVVTTR